MNAGKKKQYLILTLLKDAQSQKRIAVGIHDFWKQALSGKGQLLLVEKNYTYAAQRGSKDDVIYEASEPYNMFSCIRDGMDDVIEKVLKNGGVVQFV